jgi:hypothetical protein
MMSGERSTEGTEPQAKPLPRFSPVLAWLKAAYSQMRSVATAMVIGVALLSLVAVGAVNGTFAAMTGGNNEGWDEPGTSGTIRDTGMIGEEPQLVPEADHPEGAALQPARAAENGDW